MKYINYIFAILLLCTMASCEDFFETTLELEEPEFESQLALSAVFNSNETNRRVLLTETVGLNENNLRNKVIEDANISLTAPDGNEYSFELINSAPVDGYSHITYTPTFTQEGTYFISASTPDGRSVTSTTTLLPKPKIVSAVYVENGGQDEFGSEQEAIDIIIDDELEAENFYKITVERNYIDGFKGDGYITSLDPSTSQSAIFNAILSSDAQYNGEEYRIRILMDKFFQDNTLSFTVSLSNISKDQHRFDKILLSAAENRDNPFTTPVQLHTNMEGGLGLFAIERMIEIDVEK